MRRDFQRGKKAVESGGEEGVYSSLKPSVNDLVDSISKLHQTSAQFLKTDVETALLFSSIALESDEESKRLRNRQSARRGYDTVTRLAAKIQLSEGDQEFLVEKLARLKSNLQRLGEIF